MQALVAESLKGSTLAAGTTYYVRVRHVNSAGAGEATNAGVVHSTATTPYTPALPLALAPRSPPGQPQGVKVYADTTSNTQLLVTWNSVDSTNGGPITKYIVEYSAPDTLFPAPTVAWHCANCGLYLVGDELFVNQDLRTVNGGVGGSVVALASGDRFGVQDQQETEIGRASCRERV